MKEIIELIQKAKIKYNKNYISLEFCEGFDNNVICSIINLLSRKTIIIFNTIDELRNHLNE